MPKQHGDGCLRHRSRPATILSDGALGSPFKAPCSNTPAARLLDRFADEWVNEGRSMIFHSRLSELTRSNGYFGGHERRGTDGLDGRFCLALAVAAARRL